MLEYEFFHKWPYCIRAHIHSKKGIDESHDHQFINLFEIVCFNQFRIVIEEKTSIGYKLNLRSNLLCNRIEFASKLHLAFLFTSEYRRFNISIE